jgi:DNA repair protein RadC
MAVVYNLSKLTIKHWSEEDQPREKLMNKGKSVLTSAELIAILIGSGNNDQSAVELSKQILDSVNNDLSVLSKLSIHDLMKFKGIGEAKAISIIAALELGRRRKDSEVAERSKISSSKAAYDFMYESLVDLSHEEFWVIYLNRANIVIRKERTTSGGITGTIVDGRLIFKIAVECLACGIILVHNHPSGSKDPSQADKQLTNKLREAGKLLDVPVLDHLIFTDTGYFSFADEGLL